MQTASGPNSRAESLDVLRGLASLTVMFSHVVIAFQPLNHSLFGRWSPLSILFAGHQAVVMFFVLSGYALTCMIGKMQPFGYLRFVAARVVRLYPPYAFSIIFTLVLFGGLAIAGYQWEYGWMNVGKPYLSIGSAIQHVLMVGVFGMADVNPVIWSLVYEMRLSIVFPVILALVTRFGFRAVLGFVALSVLYWLRYSKIPGAWPTITATANLLETIHYGTFFAIGCWIALNIEALRAQFERRSVLSRIIVTLLAAALYTFCINSSYSFSERALSDLGTGAGASILIIASFSLTHGPFFRIGQWLGKISYSLYLTHTAVLNACLIVLYKVIGGPTVACVAIALSLLLATLVQAAIERPSIKLSRNFTQRAPSPASVAG